MKDTFQPGARVRLNEDGQLKMKPAAETVGWDVTQAYRIVQKVTQLDYVLARLLIRDARGKVVSLLFVDARFLEPVAPARP